MSESANTTLEKNAIDYWQGLSSNHSAIKMAVISDIHLLPEAMIADHPVFYQHLNQDRKLLVESQAIFQVALNRIAEAECDILLITGDLTKDGEYLSHQYVSQQLSALKERLPKLQILVIPGNHDIHNVDAMNYAFDQLKPARVTWPHDFENFYYGLTHEGELSYYKDSEEFKAYLRIVNQAYSRESDCQYYAHGYLSYAFSYEYQLNEETIRLKFICLDTNQYSKDATKSSEDCVQDTFGKVSPSQMAWLVKEAQESQERGEQIIVLGHHAFLPHFYQHDKFLKEYILSNWDEELDLKIDGLAPMTPKDILLANNIHCVFTGHMHAQDIAQYRNDQGQVLYDIETGSIISYPSPMRWILLSRDPQEVNSLLMDIKSEKIKSVRFLNPKKQWTEVSDLQKHASQQLLSAELMGGLTQYSLSLFNPNNFSFFKLVQQYDPRYTEANDLYKDILRNFVALLGSAEEPGIQLKVKASAKIMIYSGLSHTGLIGEPKIGFDIQLPIIGHLKLKITHERAIQLIDEFFKQATDLVLNDPWLFAKLAEIHSQVVFDHVMDPEGHKLLEVVNRIYLTHLGGNEQVPEWVNFCIEQLRKKETMISIAQDQVNPFVNSLWRLSKLIKIDLADYLESDDDRMSTHFMYIILDSLSGKNLSQSLKLLGFRKKKLRKICRKMLDEQNVWQEPLHYWLQYLADFGAALVSENQAEYHFAYLEDNDTQIKLG